MFPLLCGSSWTSLTFPQRCWLRWHCCHGLPALLQSGRHWRRAGCRRTFWRRKITVRLMRHQNVGGRSSLTSKRTKNQLYKNWSKDLGEAKHKSDQAAGMVQVYPRSLSSDTSPALGASAPCSRQHSDIHSSSSLGSGCQDIALISPSLEVISHTYRYLQLGTHPATDIPDYVIELFRGWHGMME